jgi:hypothetical protein
MPFLFRKRIAGKVLIFNAFCFSKKYSTFVPGFYAGRGRTHADKLNIKFAPQIVPLEIEINFNTLFDSKLKNNLRVCVSLCLSLSLSLSANIVPNFKSQEVTETFGNRLPKISEPLYEVKMHINFNLSLTKYCLKIRDKDMYKFNTMNKKV